MSPTFDQYRIIVVGTNLNAEIRPNIRLFECIIRHWVPWVQEADRSASLEAGPDRLIIDEITIDE